MTQTIYTSEKFELRNVENDILIHYSKDNFEVRRCDFVFNFNTGRICGHYSFTKFGIWDKLNKGFVSMHDFCQETNEPIPTTWDRKWVAEEAIASGLYEGYNIVMESRLTPIRKK